MKQINLFGKEFAPGDDQKYTTKIGAPIYEPKNKDSINLFINEGCKSKKSHIEMLIVDTKKKIIDHEKSMVNATQLMIRLYSEEDEKYGVKYAQGVVTNLKKPLTP